MRFFDRLYNSLFLSDAAVKYPIHYAASNGNVDSLARQIHQQILKDGEQTSTVTAMVNTFNEEKETPLNYALALLTTTCDTELYCNIFKSALLLLQAGADPYLTDPTSVFLNTPIHRAITNKCFAAVLLLILFEPNFERVRPNDRDDKKTASGLLKGWESIETFPGLELFQVAEEFAIGVRKIHYKQSVIQLSSKEQDSDSKVISSILEIYGEILIGYNSLIEQLKNLLISANAAKQPSIKEIQCLEILKQLCIIRRNRYSNSFICFYEANKHKVAIDTLKSEIQELLVVHINSNRARTTYKYTPTDPMLELLLCLSWFAPTLMGSNPKFYSSKQNTSTLFPNHRYVQLTQEEETDNKDIDLDDLSISAMDSPFDEDDGGFLPPMDSLRYRNSASASNSPR